MPSSEPTSGAVAILRTFDVAKAKEFQLDFLGFRLDRDHRFSDGAAIYMQIAPGDPPHCSEYDGDCVYLRTVALAGREDG